MLKLDVIVVSFWLIDEKQKLALIQIKQKKYLIAEFLLIVQGVQHLSQKIDC